jgi:hypothetical protein
VKAALRNIITEGDINTLTKGLVRESIDLSICRSYIYLHISKYIFIYTNLNTYNYVIILFLVLTI